MTQDFIIGYLSAFLDGEGHVSLSRNTSYPNPFGVSRRVAFTNTDRSLIDFVASCLEELGIPFNISRGRARNGRKMIWDVAVTSKEGFEKLDALLKPQCLSKASKLKEVLRSYKGHCRLPDNAPSITL